VNHTQLHKRVLVVLVKDTAFSYADIWKAARMMRDKGSSNSGNYNHAGRPGQIGGSAPSESDGGGSKENNQQREDISGLLGKEHTDVKGQAAIETLLKEKSGHVKGAFHRKGVDRFSW
jgi:hypothetical protein